MKVALIRFVENRSNVKGWLKPNKRYLVLAVEGFRGESWYRIESEDNRTPVLFESELFHIVDARRSSYWIEIKADDSPREFMPPEFALDGFWDQFFDGEPSAREIYEEVARKLSAEFPDLPDRW